MRISADDVVLALEVGVEVVNLLTLAAAEGRDVTPEEMAGAFTKARIRMDAADNRFDQAVAAREARKENAEPGAGG